MSWHLHISSSTFVIVHPICITRDVITSAVKIGDCFPFRNELAALLSIHRYRKVH